MRFGPTALEDAESAILAHGFRLPGRVLKKGQRLAAADLEALRAAGYRSVTTARLDEGDVGEDEAARVLAEALAGDGLVCGNAFTGRCNLLAATRGVFCVDAGGLREVNAVSEELTVATLAPDTVVDRRRLAATVKIIPFAVHRADLDRCVRLVRRHGGIVRVAAFRPRRAGLLLTTLPGTKPAILDKTGSVLREKLAEVGAAIADERRCPHDERAVAAALGELIAAECELVLVVGASAIVDRRDVVPAAIEAAGGTLERLGIPVDPGNLCLLSRIGSTRVIGLPGSSRSPAASGSDFLLRRVGAGLALDPRELDGWGSGGLLKEHLGRIAPRSAPEEGPGAAPPSAIAAIVLAAGQSRRMGRRNKLLVPVDGEPMVRRAVRAAANGASAVVVVTGHEREQVESALAGLDVTLVHNPAYESGLSTSLARGVSALSAGVAGAVVCLADMPDVRAEHHARLRAAFDPEAGGGDLHCHPPGQARQPGAVRVALLRRDVRSRG